MSVNILTIAAREYSLAVKGPVGVHNSGLPGSVLAKEGPVQVLEWLCLWL